MTACSVNVAETMRRRRKSSRHFSTSQPKLKYALDPIADFWDPFREHQVIIVNPETIPLLTVQVVSRSVKFSNQAGGLRVII